LQNVIDNHGDLE